MVSFDGEWVYYCALPRPEGSDDLPTAPAGGCRHLQDPRQDAEDRPLTHAAIHAQHRGRRLVEGLPHAGAGQELHRLRRVQHGPMPAARRQGRLHQQPQRLPAAQATAAYAATVRHGRRRRQRRVHRPSEPGHGPAPGRPEGWPGHVQLAGIAGAAHLDPLGPVEHPSRRHQLGPDRQRVPAGRQPERLPLPDAAVRRLDRGRGVLQPDEQRLRRFRQVARPRRRPVSPAFGPGYHGRPAQPAAAPRAPRRRPTAHPPPAVQPARHRVADPLRPDRRRAGRFRRPRPANLDRASAR